MLTTTLSCKCILLIIDDCIFNFQISVKKTVSENIQSFMWIDLFPCNFYFLKMYFKIIIQVEILLEVTGKYETSIFYHLYVQFFVYVIAY